jgi:hypothetical protein
MQKEFEIKIPAEDNKLVANCIFAADTGWHARIRFSQDILAPYSDDKNAVTDAAVTITEGDRKISLTTEYEYGDYYSSTGKAIEGKTYHLDVSAPGFDPVTAVVTVPISVDILGVETALVPDHEDPDDNKRIFNVRFKDPANELNYYGLMVMAEAERPPGAHGHIFWSPETQPVDPTNADEYHLESFDDELRPIGGQNLLFSDRLFNGDEHTLSVSCHENRPDDVFSEEVVIYHIYLKSLSPEYYNYRVTYNLQQETRKDPFAQPVQVFNNIKNGYGIFAAYSQSYYELKLK